MESVLDDGKRGAENSTGSAVDGVDVLGRVSTGRDDGVKPTETIIVRYVCCTRGIRREGPTAPAQAGPCMRRGTMH